MTIPQPDKITYNPNEIIAALSPERLHPYLLFTATKSEEASLVRNRVYEIFKEHYRWRRKNIKSLANQKIGCYGCFKRKPYALKSTMLVTMPLKRAMGVGDIISGLSFGAWIDILKEKVLIELPYGTVRNFIEI